MSRHVVEIAEEDRTLSLSRGFLVISERGDTGQVSEIGRVPLDDVLAVILSAQRGMLSKPVAVALAERGAITVLGGANYHPVAMITPIAVHYETSGVQRDQLAAKMPLRKRLWRDVIKAKIEAQAMLLDHQSRFAQEYGQEHSQEAALNTASSKLLSLAKNTRPGDPENLEAQAARLYWSVLMGSGFTRDQAAGGRNAHLNYGYMVLRAAMARAVIACGLNPAIGLHHRSRVNPFCLVDDMLEPFRPLVDRVVVDWGVEAEGDLTPERKRTLAGLLDLDLEGPRGATPLRQIFVHSAQSLAEAYANPDERGRPERRGSVLFLPLPPKPGTLL